MVTLAIPEKIQSMVYRKRLDKAMWLIAQLIDDIDKGLFAEYYIDLVRCLNMYRIRLLVERRMYREALAYVSLEIEMFPDNPNSLAYREFLIRQINSLNPAKPNTAAPSALRNKWKGIAGMQEVKTIIERDIILPFCERELYERFKVPMPNGMLFYGPPGCGKTFLARKIAQMINYNFIEVNPSTIGSTYVHGTQLEIKKVFEQAEADKPTLLFLDEIEALVPPRTSHDVSFHYKAEVNEFLAQLDQCHQRGILVVGATNFLQNIDSAVLRPGRFDKKIFIGPPDYSARIEAFKIHMAGRPQEEIKWQYLAEMTEFYTFAEIEQIVNEAGRMAIAKNTLIDTNILGTVITSTPHALNSENITKYV